MTSGSSPLAPETVEQLRQVSTATLTTQLSKPGDVLVGDGEGVVCIPRHVADKVAASSLEQDRLEAFLLEKIKRGAPLPGTYPPDAATLAEYEARKRR